MGTQQNKNIYDKNITYGLYYFSMLGYCKQLLLIYKTSYLQLFLEVRQKKLYLPNIDYLKIILEKIKMQIFN